MKKIFKFSMGIILFINLLSIDVLANDFPSFYADSYIVIDKESGRIIASKNPHKKLPIASTTKIVTAITAIKKINNLYAMTQIPDYCTNIEGSSLYLNSNDKVSLIDLLYGLMLRSGNDAALAIANFAGNNDIKSFIDEMNDFSRKLGALNSNFTNPHGLHDDNHYTTAYDLAIITKYALNNKVFKQICSSKSWKAESLDRILYNKNKVVLNYANGTGVKIGYTKKAGRCIVASAQKNGIEFIIVLLNDNNWFNDCYKIFNWAFSNYEKYNIIQDEQLFFYDNNTSNSAIIASTGFSYLLKKDELDKIKIESFQMPFLVNDLKTYYYGYYKVLFDNALIYTGNLEYYRGTYGRNEITKIY